MEGPYDEAQRREEEGSESDPNTSVETGYEESRASENLGSQNMGSQWCAEASPKTPPSENPTVQRPGLGQPVRGCPPWSSALVSASCCLAGFVCVGTAFSVGSVFLDIMDTFTASRPLAAMVQSTCIGIGFGSGIVTGPLISRLGRPTALMIAGVLLSGGCLACSFAPNIYVLIACFGGVTGMGISFCYIVAQVEMGVRFPERRNVTVAMVSVSAGIGQTLYPGLARWLVDEYALRGMFLILGALGLHLVLFGVVLRTFRVKTSMPTVSMEMEVKVTRSATEKVTRSSSGETTVRVPGQPTCQTKNQNHERESGDEYERTSDATLGSSLHERGGDNLNPDGDSFLADNDAHGNWSRQEKANTEEDRMEESVNDRNVAVHCRMNGIDGTLPYGEGRATNGIEMDNMKEGNTTDSAANGQVNREPDSHPYLYERPQEAIDSENTGHKARSSIVTISERVDVFGCPDQEAVRTEEAITGWSRSQTPGARQRRRSSVSETFQLTLLCSPRFVVIAMTCVTCFITYNSPLILLTDIVKGRGLDVDQGTLLLVVMLGCNIAGRATVVLSQAACPVSPLKLFGSMHAFVGLTVLGFAFMDYVDDEAVVAGYTVVCVVLGYAFGAMSTSLPLTCMQLVGTHQYPQALGYLYCVVGLCTLAGGPLGGWIKEQTGSYNAVFYMASFQGFFAAANVTAVICCSRRSRRR